MKIIIGSYIEVFCSGGISEAGYIVELSQEQMVLQLSDQSYSIIKKPDDNIVMIRIKQSSPEIVPEELGNEQHLRFKKLAELYKLKANEERKQARERLLTHNLQGIEEVEFGLPDFRKPIFKYPGAQVKRRS